MGKVLPIPFITDLSHNFCVNSDEGLYQVRMKESISELSALPVNLQRTRLNRVFFYLFFLVIIHKMLAMMDTQNASYEVCLARQILQKCSKCHKQNTVNLSKIHLTQAQYNSPMMHACPL